MLKTQSPQSGGLDWTKRVGLNLLWFSTCRWSYLGTYLMVAGQCTSHYSEDSGGCGFVDHERLLVKCWCHEDCTLMIGPYTMQQTLTFS